MTDEPKGGCPSKDLEELRLCAPPSMLDPLADRESGMSEKDRRFSLRPGGGGGGGWPSPVMALADNEFLFVLAMVYMYLFFFNVVCLSGWFYSFFHQCCS